jgi:hypothetical protein
VRVGLTKAVGGDSGERKRERVRVGMRVGKPWKGEMDEGSELRAKEGDISGERECKRVQRGLTKAAEGDETSRRGRSNGGVMQGER